MQLRLTRAVKIISIACLAVFVLQHGVDQFMGGNLLGLLALIPAAFANHHFFWQLFTYSFVHADVMQLFLNLMMLVFIGSELEATWGTRRFVNFYFICATVAGLVYLLLGILAGGGNLFTPLMGSSAPVYGLLMAYGILFSEREMLFMMLFPMKAKHFVWILAGVEFFTSVFSGSGGLTSVALLAGMATGFGLLYGRAAWNVYVKQRGVGWNSLQRSKKAKSAKHLKLVKTDPKDRPGNPKTWH